MNKLRLGGASLGVIGLTLVTFFTTGVAGALTVAAGTGGLAYLAKEGLSYLSDREGIKDDGGAYLLWRLSRAKRE
jgi:hypothetical protein